LRTRLVTIPQDAFFSPNSNIKTNLDPDALASPAECEDVLRHLELWDLTTELEGLETILNPKNSQSGAKAAVQSGEGGTASASENPEDITEQRRKQKGRISKQGVSCY
jgi:hypothetical protein